MVEIDRRKLLQGGGLAFMLLALGRTDILGGAPPAAVAATTPRRAPRQSGTGGIYTAPYSVAASCVLSQDCFLTSAVVLDDPAQDRIVPFTNSSNGAVEALVVSGGTSLSYLARDPSAVSGWSYTTLWTPGDSSLTDMTVITGSDGTTFAMVLQTEGSQRRPHWAMLDAGGTWNWQDGPDLVPDETTPLRAGLDLSGNPYFYTVISSSSGWPPSLPGTVLLWHPQPGNYAGATQGTALANQDIADALLTWDGSVSGGPGLLARSSANQVTWYPQASNTDYDLTDAQALGPGTDLLRNELLLISGDVSSDPYDAEWEALYLFYDGGGQTLYLGEAGWTGQSGQYGQNFVPMDQSGQTPIQAATLWTPPWTEMSLALLDTAGVLSIVNSTEVAAAPLTPRLPIANGLLAAVGLPTDASESTLFVVDGAATLNVLSRDPATLTWSSTPVQAPSPEVVDLSTWRVQLTVSDANGLPVAGSQVSITPDQTIGVWQSTGNTILSPSSPLTATTDTWGRVTFAYPATELATAALSVQVLANGVASGAPVTVNPDGEVHAFLSGSGTLSGIGTLNGSALLTATNATGDTLLPTLAGLSGSAQQDAATAVATAIGKCMSAGLGATPAVGDATQWSLDLSGGQPSYSSAATANLQLSLGSSDWWDSVKHDLGSAWHGVEHGVIKVTQVVFTWSEDAIQWTVNLAIDLGNGISDAMSYVVNDVRSAVAAIGGIVSALGADIDDFVEWMRMEIAGLFSATASNADTMYGWLSQGSAALQTQLGNLEDMSNGFFQKLEGRLTADLQSLSNQIGDQTLASFVNTLQPPATTANSQTGAQAQAASSPTTAVGTSSPELTALQIALQPIIDDVHYLWMFDKVLSAVEGGQFSLTPDSSVDSPFSNLIATVEQDSTSFFAQLQTLAQNIEQACPQADDLYTLPFSTLIGWVIDLVDDLLQFADSIVDAALELAEAVVATLDSVFTQDTTDLIPLLGGILQHFGVDDSLTVGKLFSYLIAFPATLYTEHSNPGQPLYPGGASLGSAALSADEANWEGGLAVTAAVIQVLWSFWDVAVDAFAARDETPPFFLSVGDAVTNALLQCVQWPGAANADGTQPPPFTTAPPLTNSVDKMSLSAWMLAWSDTLLCAAIGKSEQQNVDVGTTIFTTLLSVFALGNLGLSIAWAVESQSSDAVMANVIMSYIPDSTEIFVSEFVEAATDEGSMTLKLVIDLICNFGAGVTDIPAYGSGSGIRR